MPNLASDFRNELVQNINDFEKLYSLAMRKMRSFVGDFTTTPAEQFVSLKREALSNITMPSIKDSNQVWATNFVDLKERIVQNYDCKIDLKFTEAELQTIRRHWINNKDNADQSDIFSLGGQQYFMDRLFAKAEAETASGIWRAARINTVAALGGTNLYDGLWASILAAIAGSLISGSTQSVYTSAAPTLTSANILPEFKKFRDKIVANTAFYETVLAEGGDCFIAPEIDILISDALDSSLSNADQVFMKTANGYVIKGLEGMEIKKRLWMIGSSNFFATLKGNLHWIPGNDSPLATPSLEIQKVYRDLVVLADFKAGVNFADPRGLMMYRSYGTWN